ncbi:MAG: ribbon-helix-helix protein, CopG family [Deltaproteobacteria bacterium]|nr:ribbon-helix-helix protein, CopG family [Deltaproteobacteria bacterium]
MRTTVDLDAPLLERAKRRAARRGQTLSQLVRDAVSTYLARQPAGGEEPFELVTCGDPGGYAPTPAEMAAALDEDDAGHGPRKPGADA